MNPAYDWYGRTLQTALNELPSLSLDFYSYGVLLRKREGDALTEFAVDPAYIALALAAKITFDTGLLDPHTLLVRQEGVQQTVAGFRPAQHTGIFMEDSDTPIRIPLPPLVLIRTTTDHTHPSYQVYCVKRRPTTLDTPLFHAPIPNVFASGGICWGTVPQVSPEALQRTSLAEDWSMLLGTRFNSHGVSGKSKAYPRDIREHLLALGQRNARSYPKRDLVPVNKTLAQVLERTS